MDQLKINDYQDFIYGLINLCLCSLYFSGLSHGFLSNLPSTPVIIGFHNESHSILAQP